MIQLQNRYEYSKSDIIGSGSFGDCYLALDKQTNRQCVIKISRETEQMNIEKMMNEARQLETLNHPNIARGFDHFIFESEFYIVMDYYENSDLQQFLLRNQVTDDLTLVWLTQIASALNYLHSHKIIHRDLKFANLFISKNNDVFLGDFGAAKELKQQYAQTFVGTPQTMSPELLNEQPYGTQSDMWGLGCVLYELLEGHAPFRGSNFMGLMKIISEGRYEPLKKANQEFSAIVHNLLQVDPSRRWTSHVLCKHLEPQLGALGLPAPLLVDQQIITHQLTQAERTLINQYNNIQEIVMQSGNSHKSYSQNINQNYENGLQKITSLSDQIKQKLYEKLLFLLQDDNLAYKLVIAYTFILQKDSLCNVLQFLQIPESPEVKTDLDYVNDIQKSFEEEEEFMHYVVGYLLKQKQSDSEDELLLTQKQIVLLIKKIGLVTFINEDVK